MNTEQAELFFSILTLATLLGTLSLLVSLLAARRLVLLGRFVQSLRPVALRVGAVIAITCMAGSLYFSEVAGFVPCTLCWYQRIAMYSLAVILAIAALRNDVAVRRYAIPLAGIGITIATYHWLLERLPAIDAGACSATVPCEFVWFEEFGVITLPFMALTGFAAVITLLAISATPVPVHGGTR